MGTSNRVQIAPSAKPPRHHADHAADAAGAGHRRIARLHPGLCRFRRAALRPHAGRADRGDAGRPRAGINIELSFPDDNSPLSDYVGARRSSAPGPTPTRATMTAPPTASSPTSRPPTRSSPAPPAPPSSPRRAGIASPASVLPATTACSSAPPARPRCRALSAPASPTRRCRPPPPHQGGGLPGRRRPTSRDRDRAGSTLLDFTTLGLVAGKWAKVGGTAAGDKFATAALNAWMRITAVAATALTFDNLRPSAGPPTPAPARPSRSGSAIMSATARPRPRSRSRRASSTRPRRPTSSTPACR
jgi:hypothetical protein